MDIEKVISVLETDEKVELLDIMNSLSFEKTNFEHIAKITISIENDLKKVIQDDLLFL
jgi:hypothetical protein